MSLSRTQHGFGHDSGEGEHGCCEALLTKHTSARHSNTAEGLALNTQDPKISPGEQHPANTNSYCWQGRKATEAHLPRGCRSLVCRHKTFSKARRERRKAPRMLLSHGEALGSEVGPCLGCLCPLVAAWQNTKATLHRVGPDTSRFNHRIRRNIYLSPSLETALNPKSISFNTGQKLKSTEQPSTDSPAQTQQGSTTGLWQEAASLRYSNYSRGQVSVTATCWCSPGLRGGRSFPLGSCGHSAASGASPSHDIWCQCAGIQSAQILPSLA